MTFIFLLPHIQQLFCFFQNAFWLSDGLCLEITDFDGGFQHELTCLIFHKIILNVTSAVFDGLIVVDLLCPLFVCFSSPATGRIKFSPNKWQSFQWWMKSATCRVVVLLLLLYITIVLACLDLKVPTNTLTINSVEWKWRCTVLSDYFNTLLVLYRSTLVFIMFFFLLSLRCLYEGLPVCSRQPIQLAVHPWILWQLSEGLLSLGTGGHAIYTTGASGTYILFPNISQLNDTLTKNTE